MYIKTITNSTKIDIQRNDNDHSFNIYCELMHEIRKFGKVRITFGERSILVASGKVFLSILLSDKYLDIEFVLDYKIPKAPVKRIITIYDTRIHHFVRLYNESDVDHQLISWLKRSYHLHDKE